jgi:hypothetical protein
MQGARVVDPSVHETRLEERLHAIDTTLTRMVLELANLTTKVGTQNGRIGKIEDRLVESRIDDAVAQARMATRKEVEGSFRKRDVAAAGAAWTVALIVAEVLLRRYV